MARSKGARILVSTLGSRGDVQPFVALAEALQEAGFIVLVGTNIDHVPFVESFGIRAVPFGVNGKKMLDSFREPMANGKFFSFMKSWQEFVMQSFPEFLSKKLEAIEEFHPDLILIPPSDEFELVPIAASRGIPYITTFLQLLAPSRNLPSLLNESSWFPHLLAWTLLGFFWLKSERESKVAPMLEQCPETRPWMNQNLTEAKFDCFHPLSLTLVGTSPIVEKMPADWPTDMIQRTVLTGYWVIDEKKQTQKLHAGDSGFGGEVANDLLEFLSRRDGGSPVYMGWGSMIGISAEHMSCLAVRSLMLIGKRGIILGGWAGLDAKLLEGQPDRAELCEYARKNVIFAPTAPHEWLFPQCCAIVHHGGAGTTAAALRSGVPSVVTPFFMDQFGHARLVSERGAGVGLCQFSKVTSKTLAAALEKCINDRNILTAAKDIGNQLKKEDGLRTAVEAIDDYLADEVKTGQWKTDLEERGRLRAIRRARGPISIIGWMIKIFFSKNPNDFRLL